VGNPTAFAEDARQGPQQAEGHERHSTWGGAINMWGKHLIIGMTAGDRERVRSAAHISRFVETLVETIGMKAYGAPLLEHFAEHVPEAAGYSLVQLIETSAITGHF
jgi:hypothetical protein